MGGDEPIVLLEMPRSGIDALIRPRLVLCLCILVSLLPYFDFVRTYLPRWEAELRLCGHPIHHTPTVTSPFRTCSSSSDCSPQSSVDVLLSIASHCVESFLVIRVAVHCLSSTCAVSGWATALELAHAFSEKLMPLTL